MLYTPSKKPVQLVKDIAKVPTGSLGGNWPRLCQHKYDGVFAYGISNDALENNGAIFSRTGNPYVSMQHLSDALAERARCKPPVVFLFEIVCDDVIQSKVSGMARKADGTQYPGCHGVIFDMVPYDAFVQGSCSVPYSTRFSLAIGAVRFTALDDQFLVAESSLIDSLAEARVMASDCIGDGGEGVVFKELDAGWHAGKRLNTQVKIKQGLSFDLTVVEIREGKGKYAGTLGTIGVRWRPFGNEDADPTVQYISGMSDEQREYWWNTPAAIISKIVQVDAMTYTLTGNLREPRFKGIRGDKLESDL